MNTQLKMNVVRLPVTPGSSETIEVNLNDLADEVLGKTLSSRINRMIDDFLYFIEKKLKF